MMMMMMMIDIVNVVVGSGAGSAIAIIRTPVSTWVNEKQPVIPLDNIFGPGHGNLMIGGFYY
jgi:hypothetical protein